MSIDDARKYFVFGLHQMATSEASLQERLATAYGQYIVNASGDVPPNLKADWSAISGRMTAQAASGAHGSFEMSAAMMTEDEVKEIIGALIMLLSKLA